MTRRPMCLVCLFLMLAMCLADGFGMPLIRGNPLPSGVQAYLKEHPETAVCGEAERCAVDEFSTSVYLKNCYFTYHSDKISLGNIRVFLKNKKETVPAGTVILVSGNLEEVPEMRNPGEFDSRQYYACQHIFYFLKKGEILKRTRDYSRYRQFLLDMRERFSKVLKYAAGEEAPVLEAVVLGEKSGLDTETKLRYQMGGIVHMLAISGLHISVLGVGLYQLLMKTGMGISLSGLLSLAIMLQYGMMTGGSVSTMRAVCMFLIAIGAKVGGRIYDMPTALSVAAILLLLESPAYLYSSSFLLSFGAVLGIGSLSPALISLSGVKKKFWKTLLSSLGVQLATLPVMLYFFGEVSLAGILLNLAVLPTVGAVLGSGVASAVSGCVYLPLAKAMALPGRLLLIGYEKLCAAAGRLPFCTWIGGRPRLWQTAVYYGMLGMILAVNHVSSRKKKHPKEGKKASFGVGILCVFCLCAGILVLGYRNHLYLSITCLDVGQGEGIVVETPEKYCFLIDGGSSDKSGIGQYQLLPYLKNQGISYIDGILISHTDEDHISGVREFLGFVEKGLTSVRVGNVYLPDWKNPPESYEELAALAKKAGAKVRYVSRGKTLNAGEMTLHFLAPEAGTSGEDVNENGVVFQLEYRKFKGLFTGDTGFSTEKELLEEGLLTDVDFLKISHHGSKNSTGQDFLEVVKPECGVISCSETNRYGHPSPETVKRLEEAGCRVEYTMKNGAVTVFTDGEEVGIATEGSFANGVV